LFESPLNLIIRCSRDISLTSWRVALL